MKRHVALAFSMLLLVGCGGGGASGGGSTPQISASQPAPVQQLRISISTPSKTALVLGEAIQLNAAISGGSGSVQWSVVSPSDGGQSSASISVDGEFTAPPSVGGVAREYLVRASVVGQPNVNDSVTITVNPDFSAQSLNGTYILQGAAASVLGEAAAVGRLSADGRGNLTFRLDINGSEGFRDIAFRDDSASGTYTVRNDGIGSASISGSSSDFLIAMRNADEGVMSIASDNVYFQLTFEKQAVSIPTVTDLAGTHVVNFNGGRTSGETVAVGVISIDEEGQAQGGRIVRSISGDTSAEQIISGALSIDVTSGRGALVLQGEEQRYEFITYAKSPDQIAILSADAGQAISGSIERQQLSSDSASFPENAVLAGIGTVEGGFLRTVGVFSSNFDGVFDGQGISTIGGNSAISRSFTGQIVRYSNGGLELITQANDGDSQRLFFESINDSVLVGISFSRGDTARFVVEKSSDELAISGKYIGQLALTDNAGLAVLGVGLLEFDPPSSYDIDMEVYAVRGFGDFAQDRFSDSGVFNIEPTGFVELDDSLIGVIGESGEGVFISIDDSGSGNLFIVPQG